MAQTRNGGRTKRVLNTLAGVGGRIAKKGRETLKKKKSVKINKKAKPTPPAKKINKKTVAKPKAKASNKSISDKKVDKSITSGEKATKSIVAGEKATKSKPTLNKIPIPIPSTPAPASIFQETEKSLIRKNKMAERIKANEENLNDILNSGIIRTETVITKSGRKSIPAKYPVKVNRDSAPCVSLFNFNFSKNKKSYKPKNNDKNGKDPKEKKVPLKTRNLIQDAIDEEDTPVSPVKEREKENMNLENEQNENEENFNMENDQNEDEEIEVDIESENANEKEPIIAIATNNNNDVNIAIANVLEDLDENLENMAINSNSSSPNQSLTMTNNQNQESEEGEKMEFTIDADADEYSQLTNAKMNISFPAELSTQSVRIVNPESNEFTDVDPQVSVVSYEAGKKSIVGYLKIQPKTVKPVEATFEGFYSFFVIKGEVTVRSTEHRTEDEKKLLVGKVAHTGSFFAVPLLCPYIIENWSESEEALLGYHLYR